jgi:hypothetical protein
MATILPAALPSDWPSLGVMHVKDEAAVYASEARGPWAVPDVLRAEAVDRLVMKLDEFAHDVESEDSWFDRYERAALDAEIDAALQFYADRIDEALAGA